MSTEVVIIIILVIILVVIIALGVWVYFVSPSPSDLCKTNSNWLWDPSCNYFQEKAYDSSLQSPSELQLYLVNFVNSVGGGPNVCLPMWYRFRYVNVLTGGYSDFSKWTASAVQAGSSVLPCLNGPGNCPGITQGIKSCSFNQPTIGATYLHYNPNIPYNGAYVFANVHRYTGGWNDNPLTPPPDDAQDEIIGFLIPTVSYPSVGYAWVDALYNPL